jgi:2-polyprenyl-6-methoxyphenol hydroxylase-like FAD-dependent oxidoreductase
MRAEDEDVVVVGGGIAGLASALAVRRAGRTPLVLERAPAWEPVGAGITLWPNAVRALEAVGVGVRDRGCAIGVSEIRRPSGTVLSRVDAAELARRAGTPMIALHRADLHDALVTALGDGRVRMGAAVERAASDGSVELSGGDVIRARLVVGADGVHSIARRTVDPAATVQDTGFVAWRGIAPAQAAGGALTGAVEAWGDGVLAGAVPIDAARIYWWAAARAEDAHALEQVGGWAAPIGGLVAATPRDDVLAHGLVVLQRPRRWHAGRVVLAGDAAHAMAPNLGQGAGQAVEDAVALGNALGGGGPDEDALAAYAAARGARAHAVQRASATMMRVAHLRGPAARLRDLAMRYAPESARRRQLEALVIADRRRP